MSVVIRRIKKREPHRHIKAKAWLWLWVVGGATSFVILMVADDWQRDVRALMGLPVHYGYHVFSMLLMTIVSAAFCIGGARAINLFRRYVSKWINRIFHKHIANALGALMTVVVLMFFVQSIVFHTWLMYMNSVASVTDGTTPEGISKPTSTYLSGGPGSVVPWESMGRSGREFMGRAPTVEQLTSYSGQSAKAPIRAYVGLSSANYLGEEAMLAVQELDRTDAFSRKVLVVITSTGTGWIDPNVAESIEYMYNGDSALVSMQYSYLPSWVSLLSDKNTVQAASKSLIDAVYARWAALPVAARPKLLVFGESLGVMGTESAYGDLETMLDHMDGALLVGPPHGSPIWKKAANGRDPASPLWQPIYDEGRHVRFGIEAKDATSLSGEWSRPRVLYLQQSSDPVVWWTPDLLYHKPDWLKGQRGPDVSNKMLYVPIISFWQVTVDLLFASDMPFGHGHNYGAKVVDAWAAIAAPSGWKDSDTLRLRRFVESHATL